MRNFVKLMIIGVLMSSLVLAGCTQQQVDEEPEMNNTPDDNMEPEPETETVEVTLNEWGVSPSEMNVEAGEVTFEISNEGNFYHELEIEGNGVEEVLEDGLEAGQTKTLTLNLEAGTYEVYCPIPGNPSHRERGMEATLVVE